MCINCAKKSQNVVLGHFLDFGALVRLDIAYFGRNNGLNDLAKVLLMLDHSKITKFSFLKDPNSQKQGVGPFS